jgi:hypothetical protein
LEIRKLNIAEGYIGNQKINIAEGYIGNQKIKYSRRLHWKSEN